MEKVKRVEVRGENLKGGRRGGEEKGSKSGLLRTEEREDGG